MDNNGPQRVGDFKKKKRLPPSTSPTLARTTEAASAAMAQPQLPTARATFPQTPPRQASYSRTAELALRGSASELRKKQPSVRTERGGSQDISSSPSPGRSRGHRRSPSIAGLVDSTFTIHESSRREKNRGDSEQRSAATSATMIPSVLPNDHPLKLQLAELKDQLSRRQEFWERTINTPWHSDEQRESFRQHFEAEVLTAEMKRDELIFLIAKLEAGAVLEDLDLSDEEDDDDVEILTERSTLSDAAKRAKTSQDALSPLESTRRQDLLNLLHSHIRNYNLHEAQNEWYREQSMAIPGSSEAHHLHHHHQLQESSSQHPALTQGTTTTSSSSHEPHATARTAAKRSSVVPQKRARIDESEKEGDETEAEAEVVSPRERDRGEAGEDVERERPRFKVGDISDEDWEDLFNNSA